MNREDPDPDAMRAVSDMLRQAVVEYEPDRDRVVRRLGFDPTSSPGPDGWGRRRTGHPTPDGVPA